MNRKIFALLIAVCLMASMFSAAAFAAGDKAPLTDGVYVETVYGNNPTLPFEVTVTIADNAIANIEVTNPGGEWSEYDDYILQSAIATFIPRILEAQSFAVDATTGATLSCAGIRSAVRSAISAAGGNPSQWSARPEKSTETVVLEGYDVVVVGLGASGVTAYCSAAESGARVFGFDAAARVGGTSAVVSGPMGVNPSDESAYNGSDVDADSFKALWKEMTGNAAKNEMIDLVVDESGPALDWAIQSLGFEFFPTTSFTFPELPIWAIYNTANQPINRMFTAALEKYKALNEANDYMLELKGTELLLDDAGAIEGVKAVAYDGTTYEIYAPSVILCTGGFGGSAEMTKEAYGYPIRLHGMVQNDGTMIRSAIEDANAGTYSMDSAAMCHSGRVVNPVRIEGVTPGHSKTFSNIANRSDVLAVNEAGVRFVNENTGMTLAESYWKAGTQFYYAIVDQAYLDNIKANGFDSVYMMINSQDFTKLDWYPMVNTDPNNVLEPNDPITEMDALIEGSITAGNLFRADTVEALGELLGMDNLAETVAAYNAACEAGEDTEFGKSAELLKKIDESTGAVYAIKAAPYCYCTNGALDVDTEIRVLNEDGAAIPGLYACGMDSMGVLFTRESGYLDFGGVAHGWCFVSGRLAGANAAAYAAA